MNENENVEVAEVIPVENQSDWEVSRKGTGIWEDSTGLFIDQDNEFTDVSIASQTEPVRFLNPERSGNLTNDEFAVRLKYGKATVNVDGIVTDEGVEVPNE